MRLWAWRITFDPSTSTRITVQESFNCQRDCQHREGGWNDSIRSARACGLYDIRLGMHPVKPEPTADALLECRVNGVSHGSYYRGRYPDRRLIGTDVLGWPIAEHNWKQPPEDPSIGCPGGHYRTPFVDSVDQYARRRTSTGDRVENPRFNEADWLIQEAVRYLEDEEERWHLYIEAERHRRWEAEEAKQKNSPQKPTRGR